MVASLLVVEGRDDMTALTEILQREMGLEVILRPQVESLRPPHIPFFTQGRYFYRNEDDHWCVVLNGQDRLRATVKTREEIEESLLADESRFHRIGLVFDPDHDDATTVQNRLQSHVLTPLSENPLACRIETGQWHFHIEHAGMAVDFMPIPWDAGPMFDNLPDVQNLERVALGILQACQEPRAQEDQAILLDFLQQLQERGRNTPWKTAFRLLNAIRHPAVEDGFMAQIFGQDAQFSTYVRSALQRTTLWDRLSFIAGYREA